MQSEIMEIDRECRYCGNKVKQTTTFREENGKITIEAYLTKCPVCNRFLRKPTPKEIRRASMNIKRSAEMGDTMNLFFRERNETRLDLGEELDNLLKKVNKLQKERKELIRNIQDLEEKAERTAKELEREVSMLREQVVTFKEALAETRMRKDEVTLRNVANSLRF